MTPPTREPVDLRVPRGTGEGLPPAQREFAILADVMARLGGPGTAAWESASPGQRAAWATLELEARLLRGGYAHYFYESSRALDDAVREGLHTLRAGEHMALFDWALAAFEGGRPPDDPEEREGLLADPPKDLLRTLASLDDDYADEVAAGSDLVYYRLTYVDARPDEFFLPW